MNTGLNGGSQDSNGFTALHLAVFNMHTDVVKFLVEEEPSIVNVCTKTGMTALHIAIFDDNVEVMNMLLKAGANALDECMTPIHLAVIADSIDAINMLIEAKADVTARSREGLTPVHFAALFGGSALITLLHRAGADISCRDQRGRAPIHLAAFCGKPGNIKVLMEAGVDIGVADNDGKTPLHYLAGNPRFHSSLCVSKTVGQLLTNNGREPVFSLQGSSEAVTTLINAGADVSCSDNDGCTPIFDAATSGRTEIIHVFIDAGANVSLRDKNGGTPICYAAKSGHVEAIMALKGAGGSVSSRDDNAQTAIFYAANYGHFKAIEALKHFGAEVSLRDENGSTPIFYAAKNGHIDAIKTLIKFGAGASIKNDNGETPWSLAQKWAPNPSDVQAALNPEPRMRERTPDDDLRIRMLQGVIDKEPPNYWLWHDLCGLYVATNNLNEAIHACEIGLKKSSTDPSPLMELTNLYAAKGDYKAAITIGMRLLKVKPAILRLALNDPQEPLITPTTLRNSLNSPVQR
jgi:uncharacterized protein